jgi:hypothetical protein
MFLHVADRASKPIALLLNGPDKSSGILMLLKFFQGVALQRLLLQYGPGFSIGAPGSDPSLQVFRPPKHLSANTDGLRNSTTSQPRAPGAFVHT